MLDDLRQRTRAHLPTFDFTVVDPVPFTPFTTPLREARVALISTAGLHLPDQPPFDRQSHAGDSSYRAIPHDADVTKLRPWWDTESTQLQSQDVNCALPLELLRESDAIGSLAPTHYSFSGSIPDPRPLVETYVPEVADAMQREAVDAVLVAPS
ncbi:MAG TPA: hypothetical protein VF618_04435 [Thermoanaerobaculia bacterium]